jgi:hypothetical protein
MSSARVAFAAGLIAVAVAVAAVMTQSPVTLLRTSAVHPHNVPLASVPGSASACQDDELLPAGTTAIGVSLETSSGPPVHLSVRAGGTVLTRGVSESGWLGKLVTVEVPPLDHAVANATVCIEFTGADERVSFRGVHAPAPTGSRTDLGELPGRMTIEYFHRGRSSWWSLVAPVARRMGIGRAWAGTWVVLLVAGLMAAAIATASWLAIREPS